MSNTRSPGIIMSKAFTFAPSNPHHPWFSKKTIADARSVLMNSKEAFWVLEFSTLEQFTEESLRNKMRKAIKLVEGTPYKITGEWTNRIVSGHVFPNHYVLTIAK